MWMRRSSLRAEVDHEHDFVAGYADKIPDTYGAPKREHATAAE